MGEFLPAFCQSYTISSVFLLTRVNRLDKTREFRKTVSVAAELRGSRLGFFFERPICTEPRDNWASIN